MKFLAAAVYALAAALLLTVAVPTAAAEAQPPVDTVRIIATDNGPTCSAVVINEGIALTARHCLGKGISVDGKPVTKAIVTIPSAGPDVALLYVPDLHCPCAPLGALPAVGDKAVTVGFPSTTGQRKVADAGAVMAVAAPAEIAPWIASIDPEFSGKYILIDNPVLEHGMSGGALFVVQNDEWVVVGVNAIGFPRNSGSQQFEINGYVPVTSLEALTK